MLDQYYQIVPIYTDLYLSGRFMLSLGLAAMFLLLVHKYIKRAYGIVRHEVLMPSDVHSSRRAPPSGCRRP